MSCLLSSITSCPSVGFSFRVSCRAQGHSRYSAGSVERTNEGIPLPSPSPVTQKHTEWSSGPPFPRHLWGRWRWMNGRIVTSETSSSAARTATTVRPFSKQHADSAQAADHPPACPDPWGICILCTCSRSFWCTWGFVQGRNVGCSPFPSCRGVLHSTQLA